MTLHLKEPLIGFALLTVLLIAGASVFPAPIYFRLLIGLGLGYALARASLGFAGSVNRAYRQGSTKLMRALMLLFTITAITCAAFLYGKNPHDYHLWINPINFGLLSGGLLFGFGMALGSCCATGVMAHFSGNIARPLLVLIFFCVGVFFGFPLQSRESWIRESWFSSASYQGHGVFLPDLFPHDGLNGYLSAILITVLFAVIVVFFAHQYERRRRNAQRFVPVASETEQENEARITFGEHPFFSAATYRILFVQRWTMTTGIIMISSLFMLLMGVTKAGWGASAPFGMWFGHALVLLGIAPEAIAEFTGRPAAQFTQGILENPVGVQDIAIMLGAVIAMLLAGRLSKSVMRLQLSWREALMLSVAGLTLGFGTRLANGCNVGALYTPIANFSLSGWIFLIVMVLGAVVGNKVFMRVMYQR